MIIVDTSGLLAAMDAGQQHHKECAAIVAAARGPFLLSPFVLAELDYLLMTRVGVQAEFAMLEEVARGAYQLEPFDTPDLARALEIVRKYEDLKLGLADASIVVLAERHSVRDVLSLDKRHLHAVRTRLGRPLRVLPGQSSRSGRRSKS